MIPLVISILLCTISLTIIFALYYRMRKGISFYENLLKNNNDLAIISYNKRKHIITTHGSVEKITGIRVKSGSMKMSDYNTLMEVIYLKRDDFENDIYIAASGKKWYRLASYEVKNVEYTTIRNVTEYMEKIHIINNLRYYDSLTGLFNKQATADMLRRIKESGHKSIAIAHFAIAGMERLISFEGVDAADQIITKLAYAVKNYEDPQNTFAGRTENNGITVVYYNINQDFEENEYMIELIHMSLINAVRELSENLSQYLKVFCGFSIYRGGDSETDAVEMLSAAEFAAFSAHKTNSETPVRYDPVYYEESAIEFVKIRIFSEIISEELIDYHYQPIVNAHTGDIYGYEALMRPREIDGTRLSPLELLDIAAAQNMLERIESITFNMTLKALSEHQDIFHDKRLFVNSVSSITLSDAEYIELEEKYRELFPKLVIEITEANKLSDNILPVIDQYFKPHKVHVALDDYGAGYSNDKTLIDVMPNYIKIDRSLIVNIDTDEHKRQLVSNIVSYASNQGVFSLAEGVETEAELETVIFLGVDLIQGYALCRPVPIFMHELAHDIKEQIVKFSIMHAKRDDKVFEVKDNNPVDLANLAVFGYSDIAIKNASVDFYGDPDKELDLRIICPDNTNITMRFKNVNIRNINYPVLEVGANSTFTLWLDGDNTLSTQGIRVPDTSTLNLEGAGNLTISGTFSDGVCIGGNSTQSFGEININTTGSVNLMNKCDQGTCLGGGRATEKSSIQVNAGQLIIHARGDDTLGIGALDGDIPIRLGNCKVDADISGINAIAIGSIDGNADIHSEADVSITCAGNNCCLIGSQHGTAKVSLEGGQLDLHASGNNIACIGSVSGSAYVESNVNMTITTAGDNCNHMGTIEGTAGKVTINNGNVNLTCNAKRIAAIGTISGECDVELLSGVFDINCEGSFVACIGNLEGSGNILIDNVVISAVENSGSRHNIATANGTITISGGNIFTNSADPIEAYSPNGTPLCGFVAEGYEKPLSLKIKDNEATYRYSASPTLLFEGIYMYVPDGSVRYKKFT